MSKEHDRFNECLEEAVEGFIEHHANQFEKGLKLCESPIEKILLADLMFCGFGYGWPPHPVYKSDETINVSRTAGAISPQYPVGRYHVDFAVFVENFHGDILRIAVECDGHDFHEKTKAQAARDKKRDRFLQTEGWRVLRFTGSEIFNRSAECACEVDDLAFAWIEETIQQPIAKAGTGKGRGKRKGK